MRVPPFYALLAALCLGLAPTANASFRSNPVHLDGQLNPAFSGKSYKRVAIAATNVVAGFRLEIERITSIRLQRYMKNDAGAIPASDIMPTSGMFLTNGAQSMDILKANLLKNGIELLIVVNVRNQGGEQLEISSFDDALDKIINHEHKVASVHRYTQTDVFIFEVASGQVAWRGTGLVKAKPRTTKWFNVSAVTHAKHLVKAMERDGLLRVGD